VHVDNFDDFDFDDDDVRLRDDDDFDDYDFGWLLDWLHVGIAAEWKRRLGLVSA